MSQMKRRWKEKWEKQCKNAPGGNAIGNESEQLFCRLSGNRKVSICVNLRNLRIKFFKEILS